MSNDLHILVIPKPSQQSVAFKIWRSKVAIQSHFNNFKHYFKIRLRHHAELPHDIIRHSHTALLPYLLQVPN